MKTVCIAGHFNPLHIGHINMIREAKKLGDRLVVIVANDEQARAKRPSVFMPAEERVELMKSIEGVDDAIVSIDSGTSVVNTLNELKPDVFASGCSEDHPDAIEEKKVCDDLGIKALYNVGGEKIRSSSNYLSNYLQNFYIYKKTNDKDLDFFTPDYLPLQIGMHEPAEDKVSNFHRHTKIAELLYVEKGEMKVTLTDNDWNELEERVLHEGESILLLGGGHKVEIAKGSRILEVKQGPYIDDKIWK